MHIAFPVLALSHCHTGEEGEESSEPDSDDEDEENSHSEGEGVRGVRGYFLRKRRPVIYQYQPVIQVCGGGSVCVCVCVCVRVSVCLGMRQPFLLFRWWRTSLLLKSVDPDVVGHHFSTRHHALLPLVPTNLGRRSITPARQLPGKKQPTKTPRQPPLVSRRCFPDGVA